MKVCLHCRHTALVAARARRRKRLMYGGSVLLIAVMLAGAGAVTVGVVKNRASAAATTASAGSVKPEALMQRVAQVTALPATAAAQRPASDPPPLPSPTAGSPTASSSPPLVPILAHGETTLSAGITATRSDNSVTVRFDTEGLRTRRRDRFEKLVRETLPAVYGRRADSLLAGMPDGSIAGQGDLLTELPSRGVRFALSDGWKLTLFPETRPGRDGPLVIRYRVAVIQ